MMLASNPVFAQPLAAPSSQYVLEHAVRSAARIGLTTSAPSQPELAGCVVSADVASLWVALDPLNPDVSTSLESACCDALLELGGTQYVFPTCVLAAQRGDGAWRVEIARPEEIQVVQRRRFWRAQVQEPSTVHLSRPAVDGSLDWSCRSTLLNVSASGLACLAAREYADGLEVAQTVRAVFRLRPSDEPFVIQAVVRAKTPAATEGQTVLGLQLELDGDPGQQRRLVTVLDEICRSRGGNNA